jgi:hypothetical protein
VQLNDTIVDPTSHSFIRHVCPAKCRKFKTTILENNNLRIDSYDITLTPNFIEIRPAVLELNISTLYKIKVVPLHTMEALGERGAIAHTPS